jgi:serine/threonine protein kinase
LNLEQIGPYTVKEQIIPSGLGSLYLASDSQQEGLFALRELPPGYFKDPSFRAGFAEQMQALSACGHPGIIPNQLAQFDGRDWLVRHWLPGGSLAEWLAKGALPTELALSIISQVAAALDSAHACGVLHLNLKAGNVLFNKNGAACLSDFGFLRQASGSGVEALNWLDGAPGSLSPEAALGKTVLDQRSDVYALGALAFEMLTGRTLYPANSMLEAALHHLNSPLPDLQALRPDLPAGLVQTIYRALAKDPQQRFASAGEFAEALNWAMQNPRKMPAWIISMPVMGPVAARPHKRSGRVFVGVFIILMLVAAGLYLSGLLQRFLPGLGLPAFSAPGLFLESNPTPTLAETTPPATNAAEIVDSPLAPSWTPTEVPSPAPPKLTPTPALSSTPMPTASPTPPPPSIGGANLLAFINDNDIWSVYLDGSHRTRLTEDEQPKTDLQWTPDGKGLIYSSNGCYYLLVYATLKSDRVGCFDDLEISPDMQRYIIGGTVRLANKNNSWMNFIGSLDYAYLKTLSVVPQNSSGRGIAFIGGRLNQFSPYNDLMAAVFKSPLDGRQVDMIQVFRLSNTGQIDVVHSFPGLRFELSGYSAKKDQPVLDDFGWNGEELFTLHGNILHGYGNLVLYNMDTGRADILNPVDGKCCYQDIQFSPDGQYLLFAFQDNTTGEGAQIYLISLGTIGSGASFAPIELPYYFFGDALARVEPALRPDY